jgi:hypothetical protein
VAGSPVATARSCDHLLSPPSASRQPQHRDAEKLLLRVYEQQRASRPNPALRRLQPDTMSHADPPAMTSIVNSTDCQR